MDFGNGRSLMGRGWPAAIKYQFKQIAASEWILLTNMKSVKSVHSREVHSIEGSEIEICVTPTI